MQNFQPTSDAPREGAIIPSIIQIAEGGRERVMDPYSALLRKRIIYLDGPVTEQSCSALIAQILFLSNESEEEPITLYISSPGGSVNYGLGLYDCMRSAKCGVKTVCIGIAASMGAFLLAGGMPGHRYATPNSDIMIHQPRSSGGGQQTIVQTDQMINALYGQKLKLRLERLLAANTGQSLRKVQIATNHDKWMDALQAQKFGLIDHILPPAW